MHSRTVLHDEGLLRRRGPLLLHRWKHLHDLRQGSAWLMRRRLRRRRSGSRRRDGALFARWQRLDGAAGCRRRCRHVLRHLNTADMLPAWLAPITDAHRSHAIVSARTVCSDVMRANWTARSVRVREGE